MGGTRVCTSIIVAAELRFGAEKRSSKRLAGQIATVLAAIEILPFAPPADASYALIRSTLEKAGRPMGANDLLIAAHTLALGHTLVSDNEQEFRRIRGLTIENWLRRR